MRRKKRPLEKIKKRLDELAYVTEEDLFSKLDDDETALKQIFSNCTDLMVRKFQVFNSIPCMLVYLEVLVDSKQLDEDLLNPLMKHGTMDFDFPYRIVEQLNDKLVPIAQTKIIGNLKEVVQHIVKGEVVLFVESSKQAISVGVKDRLHRQLEEPSTEAVIRGPRLGFIESLHINMALIRHQMRTPRLKMEKLSVGMVSHTDVVITYIENRAPQNVIEEVKRRILGIEMDNVLESGYIEEIIADNPYSPFPVIQTTQRPDAVLASMIEGKVAILIDGSPVALIAPVTFWHGFQTVEDYYMNFIFATMLRWLRYLFAFLAMTLPYVYWAAITASFFVLISMIRVILTVGVNLSPKMWYPFFEMTRKISLFGFLENFDAIIIVIWVASVFIKLAIYLFITSYGTAQFLHVKNWRILVWFIAPIMLVFALFPQNVTEASNHYLLNYWVPVALPLNMIALPLLLLVVGKIKQRKN